METKLQLTQENIMESLRAVMDPEIGHSIVDLGLIYKVDVQQMDVHVLMTFTTPFCPAGEYLIDNVAEAVSKLGGKANVEITFDPPWSPEKIHPELRSVLGFDL